MLGLIGTTIFQSCPAPLFYILYRSGIQHFSKPAFFTISFMEAIVRLHIQARRILLLYTLRSSAFSQLLFLSLGMLLGHSAPHLRLSGLSSYCSYFGNDHRPAGVCPFRCCPAMLPPTAPVLAHLPSTLTAAVPPPLPTPSSLHPVLVLPSPSPVPVLTPASVSFVPGFEAPAATSAVTQLKTVPQMVPSAIASVPSFFSHLSFPS